MELAECQQYSDHPVGLDEFYDMALRAACEAPEGIPFLEIGSREGGSALVLLKAIKDSRVPRPLITVDPYGGKPYHLDKDEYEQVNVPEGYKELLIHYSEENYRRAAYLLANECLNSGLDHFHFHIESADFMATFPMMKVWWNKKVLEQKFAFVYLDGEHNVAPVLKELEWFIPRMIDGGIISIDDYSHLIDSKEELLIRILKESMITYGTNRLFYTVQHGT